MDVVYQLTEKWALTLGAGTGTFSVNSDFVDSISNAISGRDDADSTVDGKYRNFTLAGQWGFHEDWDLNLEYTKENKDTDDFEIESNSLLIGLNFTY